MKDKPQSGASFSFRDILPKLLAGVGYGSFSAQCVWQEKKTYGALLLYRKHPWFLSWLEMMGFRRIVAGLLPFARLRREGGEKPILVFCFSVRASKSDREMLSALSVLLDIVFPTYRVRYFFETPLEPLRILRTIPTPASDEAWFGKDWPASM